MHLGDLLRRFVVELQRGRFGGFDLQPYLHLCTVVCEGSLPMAAQAGCDFEWRRGGSSRLFQLTPFGKIAREDFIAHAETKLSPVCSVGQNLACKVLRRDHKENSRNTRLAAAF